jgi:hypothetical protein
VTIHNSWFIIHNPIHCLLVEVVVTVSLMLSWFCFKQISTVVNDRNASRRFSEIRCGCLAHLVEALCCIFLASRCPS